MTALSPAPYLQQLGVSPSTHMGCPTCKAGFTAQDGYVYPTYMMRDGERYYILANFCSTACLLNFMADDEAGHG